MIQNMDFTQFINDFIALLVIANPLAALPAVLRITRNQTLEEKRKTGTTAAFAVGCILVGSAWFGTPLLALFGINIYAFQVAGGFILFLLSLSMLYAEESAIKQDPNDPNKKAEVGGAIVPLAIPIIAGPGAISMVIVSVNKFPGVYNQLIITCSAILVALAMGVLLYFAANLEKILGQKRINLITRIGGLILAAIAIQTLAAGFIGLFPILGVGKI
jgi:multiple antibiotic resistance protein